LVSCRLRLGHGRVLTLLALFPPLSLRSLSHSGSSLTPPGLGFYSCFLVSPSVRVSSLPPATAENPTPQQHTFFSSAAGDSFEVRPDPRGNTLGRGTEIVLEIGEDDGEFLKVDKLKALM
jgi:hypothetical protein